MSFAVSRRDFMLSSASVGAAAAASVSLPAAALSEVSVSTPVVSAELLHALGARIGLEVSSALGAANAPMTLAYIDAAGPSADALREGMERGIRWEAGRAPSSREWQAPYAPVLGAALVTNEATGRSALVEIDATALSMLSMIESVNVPASVQKQAVLSTDASNLYRVSYLA